MTAKTKVTWKRVAVEGLEAYVVLLDGIVLHSFMSENAAISKCNEINRKLTVCS